jgi:hypothetical protein
MFHQPPPFAPPEFGTLKFTPASAKPRVKGSIRLEIQTDSTEMTPLSPVQMNIASKLALSTLVVDIPVGDRLRALQVAHAVKRAVMDALCPSTTE